MMGLKVGVYTQVVYTAGILVVTATRIYGRSVIDVPVPSRGQEVDVLIQAAFPANAGRLVARRVVLFTETPAKKTAAVFSRFVRDAVQGA
eukprot:10110816-Lingulodinium_polyedra.AAC.1